MRHHLASIVLALAALLLAGCAGGNAAPSPSPTPDFDTAWAFCIAGMNPDGTMVASQDDPEVQVLQMPEEGCQRWLDTVGEKEFIEQWDADYSLTARCTWVLQNAIDGGYWTEDPDVAECVAKVEGSR